MITAVEIDELYYAEPIVSVTDKTAGLTGAEVAAILKNATTKEVKNVHGDTYQYEEAEASVTRYKNALTGEYYRETSEPGEVKINFTIGEYDYETKKDLQGGNATDKSWERGKYKPIYKCVIGKTKDGVYVVFPKASISGRGSNTDKAIGLAVSATPLSPGVEGLIHVSEMSWSQHLRSAQDFMKVGDEVEAVVLTLDREERKMSLGIKQLKSDPWETIEEKYPIGSKHTAKVRNFTNFGVFVEIEEGVDGLIHISDLSWTKKVKHPSEFTQIGADIDVQVLEIDKENRRLSLGHKQLEENPWDVFETVFTVGSVHEGTIIEMLDKGAVVALPYGVEGFATPKHLVKEDGSQAQLDEKLEFKVIEFNKDAKRIILSHSRIFEDAAKAEERAEKKAATKKSTGKREDVAPAIQNQAASTTLGDIDALAALKEQMEAGKK